MSLSGVYQNSIYNGQTDGIYSKNVIPTASVPSAQNSEKNITFTSSGTGLSPSYNAQRTFNLRTELTTKEEKRKYSKVAENLNPESKKELELLLRSGALLKTSPEDKSTTLDNLYKMATAPRIVGINPKIALAVTINTLAKPESIAQTAEDIPEAYVESVLRAAQKNPKMKNDEINTDTINVDRTGTCVAASIEFKLAKQYPAEFARFAEGLTSPKMSVDKTIHLNNLADSTLDAVWLLNAFEVPYEMNDFNTAKLTLTPDRNAIIRAQIQNSNRDYYERSLIDVLMQSTFMNVGSQQAYDALTDKRGGKFSDIDIGLNDFEKTFVETIVEDKNEISVTYQFIDMDNKLAGREADLDTVKRHILESLATGESVIIGYTSVDDNNKLIEQHEITIVEAKPGRNGKMIFSCFDSDDFNPRLVEYSEDYIIPKIHHAGLPKEVAEKDLKYEEAWVEGMKYYKEAKNNPQPQSPPQAA